MQVHGYFAVVLLNGKNKLNKKIHKKTNVPIKRKGTFQHTTEQGVPLQHEVWAGGRNWDDHKQWGAVYILNQHQQCQNPKQ